MDTKVPKVDKMKIAHVVSTYPPYKGGIGNVCFNQVVSLKDKGFDVTVFTPKYDPIHTNKEKNNDGVFLLKPWLKIGNAAVVPQLLYKLKRYKIIHIHYPFIGIESLIFLRLFNRKAKIVLQYQMDLVGRGLKGFIFSLYQKFFLSFLVKLSDRVLISSWDYFENSNLYKFQRKNPAKFIELTNGVDVTKFYPQEKDQNLVREFHPENNKILLFVGGLDKAHYFKGLETLLHAITKINNVKLLVVGDGNLRQHYIDLSEALHLQKKIVFVGKVSDDQLVKYYNFCDIFVLPSIDKSEAFGLVLLEAMACKKPVVASNLPGVRTLINDSKDGFLVKPNSVKDLLGKINILIQQEQMAFKFSQEGREKIVNKYDWVIVTKKLERIYSIL